MINPETQQTQLLGQCYTLRYEVLYREKGFGSFEASPSGMEQDAFDMHSNHLAAVDIQMNVVGTARLVLHSAAGYPLETRCRLFPGVLPDSIRKHTAEVSRLVVHKTHRKRGNARLSSVSLTPGATRVTQSTDVQDRSAYTEALFALFRAVYQESRRLGLTHWIAAMEPALRRMMRAYFLVDFQPAGPPTEYHGTVVPYLADLAILDRALAEGDSALAAALMEGLEAEFRPAWAQSRAENPPVEALRSV